MKKRRENGQSFYSYNEKGTDEVSEQIMDAYNSGVIDQAPYKQAEKEEIDTLS